jgi:hypothetical protein
MAVVKMLGLFVLFLLVLLYNVCGAIKNMLAERRLAKRRGMVFVITTPYKVWGEILKDRMVEDGLDAYLYGEQTPLDLDLVTVSLSVPYEFDIDLGKCFSRGSIHTPEGNTQQFTVFVPIPKNKGTWQSLLASEVVSLVKKHFRL